MVRIKSSLTSYPWDKWLNRKRKVILRKDKDFSVSPYCMAQQLRNAAYRRNYKVSIKINENSISFTSKKECLD